MFHILLNVLVVELATDESLGVEYGVLGVGVESVLSSVTNPAFWVS